MSERRALLLTDLVGSTATAETLGDAAASALWAEHDRVARDLMRAWNGREIDKTDGMLMLFESVGQALGFARAYNQALAGLAVPLSSRTGLHFGPVTLRHNNAADIALGAKPIEVDGLAKPIAARVMALATGGQILLTADARAALAAEEGLQIQSHGHWSIKGIAEPIELFEAGEVGAVLAPPPDGEKGYRVVQSGSRWLPVKQVPNNLPQQMTSFLGRERELDEVKGLLGGVRLVTLLGMGGLGKTRLSLQVAAESMHRFVDGVWFLDLAPIRDPALVVSEAAQVLDVKEERGRPLIQSVCAHLKDRRVLLIFDNCEHLTKAAAELAHAVLRAAPAVCILASSRETLRVPGEQSYPVHPLPVPRRDADVEALQRSAAVRLFLDRAKQHRPSFELTAKEAPQVAEMVLRLEGIPLALELAAARMKAMTLSDINARLKDRFKVLTGGGSVLLERQQTLRALVDWSYVLLNPDEQRVLARLSVFVGGFDLAAAEQVCGAEPLSEFDVMDILQSLVEKSLVMLDQSEESARYSVLETIRDYAHEKLSQSGELASIAALHCQHYFAMTKTASRGLRSAEQAEWVYRVEAELDNIRAAMSLALASGVDPIISVKIAVAMQGFWILRGYSTEGRKLVAQSLKLPAVVESDVAHGHALYVGAALAVSQGDYDEARKMLEKCLELRRRLGNPLDIASTLSTLSMARLPVGDTDGARAAEQEALGIFRELGDLENQAIGLQHLGQIEQYGGHREESLRYLQECLALACSIKHQELEGDCERQLGELAYEAGDLADAIRHVKRSLTICRDAGDKRGEVLATWWLGRVQLREQDLEGARRSLTTAVSAFRAFDIREDLVIGLGDISQLALAEGQASLAVQLAAAVDATSQRLALRRSPHDAQSWAAHLASLRASISAEDHEAAWAKGKHWDVEETLRWAHFTPVAEDQVAASLAQVA
ncbi:MAG TPA: tetratricopeptide repeat protein [Caldimonas sp.]|nr:tetratricopeptide repeat protein [Caldimonas sp.]